MSYVLLGLAIFAAFFALVYLLIAIRVTIVGSGFKTFGTIVVYALIISVGTALALWLGPIGLTGIGLL